MKNFMRTFLLLFCSLVMLGRSLNAQKSGTSSEENEFRGVFRGIGTGEMREKGAKKPIRVWKMDGDGGQKLSIPILAPDAPIQKVIASPESYIGRRCIVVYEQAEVMLVGSREPVDLNTVISVQWSEAAASPARGAGEISRTPRVSPEEVVRKFFTAIENKDLASLTELLDDPVSYYQPKPAPRTTALADIKSDWRKYNNWKGEVSNVELQSPGACTFQLNYSMMEGPKQRSGSLQCSVTFSPRDPGRISSISSKVIRKGATQEESAGESAGSKIASNIRRFRFVRPEDPDTSGRIFDVAASFTPTTIRGTWRTTFLNEGTDERPLEVEFSGQVSGTSKTGEKRISIAFKGETPYLFPANQKPYWLLKDGPNGMTIHVPIFEVFGRNSNQVMCELREVDPAR
jgi:hypothetical protein